MEICLEGKKAKRLSIRRQRTVLGYIADFMCKELMLVIEVDGITHHDEQVILKDEKKQKDLEKAGFTLLRFTDDDVLNHINAVICCLEDWIEKKLTPE